MMLPVVLSYNRLAADLLPMCEAITLTERLSGKASTLVVSLNNSDGRFTGTWAATKGDSLSISLGAAAPEQYSIDRVTVNHWPRVVQWSCSARPRTTSAPSGRGKGSPPPSTGAIIDSKKSWPNIPAITFRALCAKVCAECGLILKYTAQKDPNLANVVRFNETGWALITRYAKKYSLGVHGSADAITITAPKPSESTIPPAAFIVTFFNVETLANAKDMQPQKVVSARFDPRLQKSIKFESGGDGDGQEIDVSFDADDPVAIYSESVRSAQAEQVSIIPDARAVAGAVVSIDTLGTYVITEMIYSRSGDNERMSIKTRAA